jgi:hypothetical protein
MKMTVKDLIKVLGDFPPDDRVAILPDNANISAKICRGGIALDGGWLVMNLKTGDSAEISVKKYGENDDARYNNVSWK